MNHDETASKQSMPDAQREAELRQQLADAVLEKDYAIEREQAANESNRRIAEQRDTAVRERDAWKQERDKAVKEVIMHRIIKHPSHIEAEQARDTALAQVETLTAEVEKLRAELVEWQTIGSDEATQKEVARYKALAAEQSAQREHNANVADGLRADNARLREAVEACAVFDTAAFRLKAKSFWTDFEEDACKRIRDALSSPPSEGGGEVTIADIKSACLRAIELGEKATKGPWEKDYRYSKNEDGVYGAAVAGPEGYLLESIDDCGVMEVEDDTAFDAQARANVSFIAHSRTFSPNAAKALQDVLWEAENAKDGKLDAAVVLTAIRNAFSK